MTSTQADDTEIKDSIRRQRRRKRKKKNAAREQIEYDIDTEQSELGPFGDQDEGNEEGQGDEVEDAEYDQADGLQDATEGSADENSTESSSVDQVSSVNAHDGSCEDEREHTYFSQDEGRKNRNLAEKMRRKKEKVDLRYNDKDTAGTRLRKATEGRGFMNKQMLKYLLEANKGAHAIKDVTKKQSEAVIPLPLLLKVAQFPAFTWMKKVRVKHAKWTREAQRAASRGDMNKLLTICNKLSDAMKDGLNYLAKMEDIEDSLICALMILPKSYHTAITEDYMLAINATHADAFYEPAKVLCDEIKDSVSIVRRQGVAVKAEKVEKAETQKANQQRTLRSVRCFNCN